MLAHCRPPIPTNRRPELAIKELMAGRTGTLAHRHTLAAYTGIKEQIIMTGHPIGSDSSNRNARRRERASREAPL